MYHQPCINNFQKCSGLLLSLSKTTVRQKPSFGLTLHLWKSCCLEVFRQKKSKHLGSQKILIQIYDASCIFFLPYPALAGNPLSVFWYLLLYKFITWHKIKMAWLDIYITYSYINIKRWEMKVKVWANEPLGLL